MIKTSYNSYANWVGGKEFIEFGKKKVNFNLEKISHESCGHVIKEHNISMEWLEKPNTAQMEDIVGSQCRRVKSNSVSIAFLIPVYVLQSLCRCSVHANICQEIDWSF